MKDDNVIVPAAMIGTTGFDPTARSHAATAVAGFARIQSAQLKAEEGTEAVPGTPKTN